MNRRGFLGRLVAGAAAATWACFSAKSKTPALSSLEPPSGLSDDEVLENLEDGVYDGAPFFTTNQIVRIEANCPFIMGRGACGYRGLVTQCDKRFGSCRCPESFGGMPGVALGAPVYARPDGGATCKPENYDAAFLGLVVGVDKGSPTKPMAVTVAISGSATAVRL